MLGGGCCYVGPHLGSPPWLTQGESEAAGYNNWGFMVLLEDFLVYCFFDWQDVNICESWISFTCDPQQMQVWLRVPLI